MLQYLKYTIFFLIFALLGCETQKNMEIVTFKSYFNSNSEELWKDGLEYFKLNMDENSLEDMMSIYLNKKFSLVDDEMEILIKTFLITFDPEYEKFLTFFEDADNIPSLIDLISTFEDQYIISFAKKLYKQSASESKSKISESLGRTILNLSHVKLLYDDQDQDVRLGTIFSAGYIPGSEILLWLVDRVLEDDSELSSNAIFSLSKHGSTGFNLLADNLEQLSSRLILSALDILSFNKVNRLYMRLGTLLYGADSSLESRILKVYSTLGKSGYQYIIEGLRMGDLEAQKYLLDLLVERDDPNFIDDVLFLLNIKDLQPRIVEICFNKNRLDIVEKLLLSPEYKNLDIGELVVNYGLSNKSSLLFGNKRVINYSLEFFLSNISKDRVLDYFLTLDFDEKYIRDYILVYSIEQAIVEIKKIEELKMSDPVIARYFELEDYQLLATKESEEFYTAMEQWLVTRDATFLDKSLTIKESKEVNQQVVLDQREDFFNSLSTENLDILKGYEDRKSGIGASYNQLTYRLKYLGQRIIDRNGFSYLIE